MASACRFFVYCGAVTAAVVEEERAVVVEWRRPASLRGTMSAAEIAPWSFSSKAGDKSSSSATLGVLLAGSGGALTATGANVLAWSAHRERTTSKQWTKGQLIGLNLVCLLANLGGISLFTLSCSLGGAVATVMPIQTGSNLLANMFWQIYLEIKPFTKSMRVGTLILVCAVAELIDIGPSEPAKPDVAQLLQQPLAIAWIVAMLVATALSFFCCYLTFDQGLGSLPKLGSFIMVVSLLTVIGSSIAKTFGLLSGVALMASFAAWFVTGVCLMSFTLLANAKTDVSIFIPAQLSTQLVLNMLTGYCVWGDAQYIDRPAAYLLVYVICLMAVYVISHDLDIVGQMARNYWMRQSMLSDAMAPSAFGRSVLALLRTWQQQNSLSPVEDSDLQEARCMAVSDVLQRGLVTGAVTEREVTALAIRLLHEQGCRPNALLVHWIEEMHHFKSYCRHDPAFRDHFRNTLSAGEWDKLQAMVGSASRPAAEPTPAGELLEPISR